MRSKQPSSRAAINPMRGAPEQARQVAYTPMRTLETSGDEFIV